MWYYKLFLIYYVLEFVFLFVKFVCFFIVLLFSRLMIYGFLYIVLFRSVVFGRCLLSFLVVIVDIFFIVSVFCWLKVLWKMVVKILILLWICLVDMLVIFMWKNCIVFEFFEKYCWIGLISMFFVLVVLVIWWVLSLLGFLI